jgi:aldose sugar dehydrogenase
MAAIIRPRWASRCPSSVRHLLCVLALVVLPACDDNPQSSNNGPPPTGQVFTAASDDTRFVAQVMVTGLEVPWSLAFAPDGRLFVAERPGRVRIVQGGQLLAAPALTLADVAAVGEAGLLGLALDPDFASTRFVYLAYTARQGAGMVNRVVRYREVNNQLGEPAVLIDGIAGANIHDGARVRFGPDRRLYVTMGDAAVPSLSQDLSSPNGKILRLNPDGSRPDDNPFPSLVFSWGHRNPQGLDWHPSSRILLATEHGATANDEVNHIEPGRNYGWPIIEADQTQAGMETPLEFYRPAIAPSGGSFYTGTLLPSFRNDFFFGALAGQHLHRLRVDPANPRRVILSEQLMRGAFGRVRDVVTGPDGALYFSTSNRDGRASPVSDDDRIVRLVAAP